jgi:arylsulfatase
MADDLGYSDLGCYGSEIHTPNLDSLARGGLRLTQFYNAARCCPSRASLLTGLYPHQAGMGDMTYNAVPALPAYQGYLSKNCVTIAEVLKQSGYRTYMAGKWHVGDAENQWPQQRGFDKYFGLIDGASNYFRPMEHFFHDNSALKMVSENRLYQTTDTNFYMTTAITDHAIDFLTAHNNPKDPFFLYLAYTAPHWPLHALPEDIKKYRGRYAKGWDALRQERYQKMRELGIIRPEWALSPRFAEKIPAWDSLTPLEKDTWELRMAVYAAMVDRMDQEIGRIFARVRAMEGGENTLIIFLSDNGGCHEEVYKWDFITHDRSGKTGEANSFEGYGFPWANASNTPFQLFKHWTREGGIATPFIAHYPGVIAANQLGSQQPAHIIDLMTTCVDYARASYPQAYQGNRIQPMEGVSLRPVFERKPWKGHDALFWEHESNRAVRKGPWKLVSTYHPERDAHDAWALYNLDKDRTELVDVSKKYPKVVKRLSTLYADWAKKTGVRSAKELESLRKK